MDKLDWIEQIARGNLNAREANADLIRSQANTMLAIALSGGGAALYFAAKEGHLIIAALLVSTYLFSVAYRIAKKCLAFSDYPSSWNTPSNLNQPNYSLDELKAGNLQNMELAIAQATEIIESRSEALNRYIKALCLTPAVAIISFFVDGSLSGKVCQWVSVLV